MQCSSFSTLPRHGQHVHHSKPNIATDTRPPQLARDAPTQLLDHTYAENPDVAPLQPFNMRHSFTVMAKHADDALGIKYPLVITNQQLYDVTKCEPWSVVTERRRLSWLGHLIRLNPETPARQSFKEALRPVKRKPGRPRMTWITTIQQDLSKRDVHINLRDISAMLEKLESMCHDRMGWKARCSMRGTPRDVTTESVSAQHVTSDCS